MKYQARLKAIRKVVDGGRYISSRLAETLAFNLNTTSNRPRYETLSDREFQVMRSQTGLERPNCDLLGTRPTEMVTDEL